MAIFYKGTEPKRKRWTKKEFEKDFPGLKYDMLSDEAMLKKITKQFNADQKKLYDQGFEIQKGGEVTTSLCNHPEAYKNGKICAQCWDEEFLEEENKWHQAGWDDAIKEVIKYIDKHPDMYPSKKLLIEYLKKL